VAQDWLTATEAAEALGVKQETLYAYVSRGLLERERVAGSRTSRYRRADVERLAGRRRSGGRAGGMEIIVETALTLLEPEGRLSYRGWDVRVAAADAGFEEVATWLWTGERRAEPFVAPDDLLRRVRRLGPALGPAPVDRIRASLAAVRSADPLRHDRRPEAVAAHGRLIVALAIEALAPCQPLPGSAGPTASVAARLWPRLSPRRPSRRDVALLDTTLVLLADHELAASTLAARVAASTWADPYLVVLAGLAALGGPLHGGASERARDLLVEVRGGKRATAAVDSRLAEGELIPGFGHRVYTDHDPRAEVLLDRLLARRSPTTRAAAEILDVMRERRLPFPNVDTGLAVLAETYEMVPAAGAVIFAIARVAGWLAHAIEEYEHRLRFRPRAAYVGPRPEGPAC
jgi:citrate synthase